MPRPMSFVVALGVCLALQTTAIKHKTVVLSGNNTVPVVVSMEGATVMSEVFYQNQDSTNTVVVMPFMDDMDNCRLIVQVVYMELPHTQPCRDYVEVCELATLDVDLPCKHGQKHRMLHNFCGPLEDMKNSPSLDFKKKPPYMMTQACSNVKILFHTEKPAGDFRGFKFIITLFTAGGCRPHTVHFICDDGRCIGIDLHCDGIAHCLDRSDEITNCTREDALVPITYCGPNDQNPLCRDRRWGERWFGLAIPMAIVMVLLFFAIAVKVRKQLCHPMSLGSTYSVSASGSGARLHVTHRRERAVQAPPIPQRPVIGPGWICPHEHLNDHLSDLHDSTLPPPEVDMGFNDAATLMLLPPPYSPPEDRPPTPYDPPTEGDPPPLYEDSLHHTLQSEKAVIVPGHPEYHSVPLRSDPPAYQLLPPQAESCIQDGSDGQRATPSTSGPAYSPSELVVTSLRDTTLMPTIGGGSFPSTTQQSILPTVLSAHIQQAPSPSPTASPVSLQAHRQTSDTEFTL